MSIEINSSWQKNKKYMIDITIIPAELYIFIGFFEKKYTVIPMYKTHFSKKY